MTTQNTTDAQGMKKPVNIAIKMRGFLQHDNKYFDLTCPACGGFYSSYATKNCPKCGQVLVRITMSNGTPMGISEGTFNPVMSKITKERIDRHISGRKSSVPLTYRFKLYSFPDANGVLAPHPLHINLKKDAIVEVVCFNHPPEGTVYFSKKMQRQKVELMYHVYDRYGDTIKIVQAPKERAAITTAYKVDGQGNPAPVQPPYAAGAGDTNTVLVAMQKNLEAINALLAARGIVAGAPAATAASAGASLPDDIEPDDFATEGEYIGPDPF